MMKLSDVPGTQPEGFLVRFPFYALAERDAHILFSQTPNPDWFVDDVYEFGKKKQFFFNFEKKKHLVNDCSGSKISLVISIFERRIAKKKPLMKSYSLPVYLRWKFPQLQYEVARVYAICRETCVRVKPRVTCGTFN